MLSGFNPVSSVELVGENVEVFKKQWKKILKLLPLTKEQKQFWKIISNFNIGNWYFFENAIKNNESLINFRKKIIINIIREFINRNIDITKIAKIIQLGIDKEIDIFQKDDKNLSQIGTDLREQYLKALFSKDENSWLDFSLNHLNRQYWAGRGTEKLKDIVRSEYGLKNGAEEVFRTSCLHLLKVFPIYNEGEKPEDFKFTPQPVMWKPPTVLGSDIVGLLPKHGMSLVNYLAKRHPTYVLLINDYDSEAVMNMGMDDFVDEIALHLKFIKDREGVEAIFAGYCQGGTLAILSSLTEKLRPYVKAVFTVAAATGKKEEKMDTTSLFLEGLNLVSEFVKGGYMVAREFPSIGLKGKEWSPYGDLLNNLVKAEKYSQRISEIMEQRGCDVKKAQKVLAFELIKKIVVEIWLDTMHNLLQTITEMTLPVFRDGIFPDGSYNLKLFGKKLNVKDFDKLGIPIHIFAGNYDKVVPVASATEISKFVKNCFVHLFDGGHIAMATNFKDGIFQMPIVKAVEDIYAMK